MNWVGLLIFPVNEILKQKDKILALELANDFQAMKTAKG